MKKQIVYPDSDGQAMADNTKQFQEIEKSKRDAKLRELDIDAHTLIIYQIRIGAIHKLPLPSTLYPLPKLLANYLV